MRELNRAFFDASQEEDISKINSLREESSFKKNQFEIYLKEFLKDLDNSLAVIVSASYLPIGENINFWETIYSRYYDEFSSNSYFKKFEENLLKLKAVSLGSIAPEIILNDTTGNPISLSSLRGKYVLLDFGLRGVGHVEKKNPNIVRNYNIFKDKGFEIFKYHLIGIEMTGLEVSNKINFLG